MNIDHLQARRHLSALIDRAQAGEDIVFTRRGMAVARLLPTGRVGTEVQALAAITMLRASRQGVSLGRLQSRDLTTTGRR